MGYLATAQVLRLNITQEVIADGHKIKTTQNIREQCPHTV